MSRAKVVAFREGARSEKGRKEGEKGELDLFDSPLLPPSLELLFRADLTPTYLL